MKQIHQTITKLVQSRAFFCMVLGIFALQAAWLAITARYPMAFDEGFHVGIIRIYSQQWSPILTSQPEGLAPFGALTTDPSYIFHYLMSFPYRWLTAILPTPILVIVFLRLINVLLFCGGLVAFRRLLLQTKASAGAVHIAILFFTLIPISPLLAAHINYDNLLMLIVPCNILLVTQFKRELDTRKRYNFVLLGAAISLGLLGSLVKYAYLPFLTAIAMYIAWLAWNQRQFTPKLLRNSYKQWRLVPSAYRVLTCIVLSISCVLFLQRYAVNVVRYHNLVPQCGQVLGVDRCQAYGPWARNYKFAQTKAHNGGNPFVFTAGWLHGMFLRLLFTINGPGAAAHYDNRPPLPLITVAAVLSFIAGSYWVVHLRRVLFRKDPVLRFMLFASAIYVAAVVGRNYHDYYQLGQMVAINGRYLILVLLPVILTLVLAYRAALSSKHQALVLTVVFVLFLQGGGFLSFIYGSNRNWYRQDSQTIIRVNQQAQKLVKPFILNWPSAWGL